MELRAGTYLCMRQGGSAHRQLRYFERSACEFLQNFLIVAELLWLPAQAAIASDELPAIRAGDHRVQRAGCGNCDQIAACRGTNRFPIFAVSGLEDRAGIPDCPAYSVRRSRGCSHGELG